uniref:Uncharacterized protein n=1 Tax=Glossina austeni TaxID=7395 RepID=A0A1A9VBS1_GLOAU
MRALSISSADAFILVYDVTDATTFDEVRMIRDQIHETKATTAVPIVVVEYATTESVVTVDWENGFVEVSAARNENITQVFKELLSQAKITYNLSPALRRRRQSLPQQMGNNGVGTPTHHNPSSHAQHHHHHQHHHLQHQAHTSSAMAAAATAAQSHTPTAAQLQHLQRIQERSLGGKRNSCSIS